MVDVLIAFLECLPEPVIPTALYELALEASDSSQAMIEVTMQDGFFIDTETYHIK